MGWGVVEDKLTRFPPGTVRLSDKSDGETICAEPSIWCNIRQSWHDPRAFARGW